MYFGSVSCSLENVRNSHLCSMKLNAAVMSHRGGMI